MARRDPLAAKVAAIEALRASPDEGVPVLREALASKQSLLVAAAAAVVRDAELEVLRPELSEALVRMFDAPPETDRGCHAKLALTEALLRCNHRDPELFLRGLRVIQREPVWGSSEDSAAPLRATSALALVRTLHHGTLNELAALLADTEPAARRGAALACGDLGDRAAVPLLRFKALVGDPDPAVLTDVCASLLCLDRGESLDFVVDLLDHRDEAVADAAAIALGQSRLDGAFEPLARWSCEPQRARVGCLAIALLRGDRALAHLLDTVTNASPRIAAAAITALATWRDDPRVHREVDERVRARGRRELTDVFTKAFPARADPQS
jgi:HEAT repeat protein